MVHLVIALDPGEIAFDALRTGISLSGWCDYRRIDFTIGHDALALLDPACCDQIARWRQAVLDHEQEIATAAESLFERCDRMPGHYLLTAEDFAQAA
jgi:hypothetical protein